MKNLDSILPTSDEGLYPIRTVSEISGVNPITLRAWERRYGLFEPKRTPKGHRLYSEQDILRVKEVLDLLDKGISIGRVAKTLKDQKTVIKLSDNTQADLANKKLSTSTEWIKHQQELIDRIHTYDILQLEAFHHEFLSNYAIEVVTEELIRPVLNSLNDRANDSESLSGDYHFYKMFLLQRIGGLFLRTSIRNEGKKILLIGIDDQPNELNLLLFSLPLMKHGYKIINLGSNLNLEAIPTAVTASKADAVLLYSELNSVKSDEKSFQKLAKNINTPVFIEKPHANKQNTEFLSSSLFPLPKNSRAQVSLIDKKLNKVIK